MRLDHTRNRYGTSAQGYQVQAIEYYRRVCPVYLQAEYTDPWTHTSPQRSSGNWSSRRRGERVTWHVSGWSLVSHEGYRASNRSYIASRPIGQFLVHALSRTRAHTFAL